MMTDKHFPKIKLSRKQYKFAKKPWITHDLLKSIKLHNKLYIKYQKSGKKDDFTTYKASKNKVTRQKETAKALYFQNEIGKSKNTSSTWKAINKILMTDKRKLNTLPSKLTVNRNSVTDPASICTELNQHFCNIGHKMAGANDKPSKILSSMYFYGQRVMNSIYIEDASEDEILDIINNLNPNKAPGYDDIPTKLIKAAKFSLAPLLNTIFNSRLKNGLYPDKLKIARVIPSRRGGAKFELKNYRPISVLSAINKIFETIIKKRLTTFWTKYNVFAPTQFGFRGDHSTTLAIAYLHELIITELDNDRSVCTIFMDLAKAFDTVNHNILLYKLEQ